MFFCPPMRSAVPGSQKKPRTFLVSRGPPTNPDMGCCGALTRKKRKKKTTKLQQFSHPSFPFASNFFILPCATPKQQTRHRRPVSNVCAPQTQLIFRLVFFFRLYDASKKEGYWQRGSCQSDSCKLSHFSPDALQTSIPTVVASSLMLHQSWCAIKPTAFSLSTRIGSTKIDFRIST
jgi:hypothetical protein